MGVNKGPALIRQKCEKKRRKERHELSRAVAHTNTQTCRLSYSPVTWQCTRCSQARRVKHVTPVPEDRLVQEGLTRTPNSPAGCRTRVCSPATGQGVFAPPTLQWWKYWQRVVVPRAVLVFTGNDGIKAELKIKTNIKIPSNFFLAWFSTPKTKIFVFLNFFACSQVFGL